MKRNVFPQKARTKRAKEANETKFHCQKLSMNNVKIGHRVNTSQGASELKQNKRSPCHCDANATTENMAVPLVLNLGFCNLARQTYV
eukprot:5851810-Amphidinium_carterae.2